jgi:hypothetical protein
MMARNDDQKDPLEAFVLENRAKFDTAILPEGIWSAIENNLDTRQESTPVTLTGNRTWRYYLSIAASVTILLGIGAFGGILYVKQSKIPEAIAQQVDPEYLETEQYYVRKVDSKVSQLTAYPHDKDVAIDLAQIDQFILELKTELVNAPKSSREQIVKTMIAHYQIKLDLLDKVMQQLSAQPIIHQQKNQNNEKIDL